MFVELSGSFSISPLLRFPGILGQFDIRWIGFSSFSPCLLWNEDVFDILVQFVQDEIRKYGAKYPTLWNSTMSLVIAPVFQVSCSQEVIDETDKTVVVDLLAKDLEQKAMIDSVERAINSMPWSRTQNKRRQQKSRSLILVIPSLDAGSR